METHHHKTIRLSGHDYRGPAIYFITICTLGRKYILGEIRDGQVVLSEIGRIVEQEWARSAELRKEIVLDEHIIMPNHLHGIVFLDETTGAHSRAALQPDSVRGSRDRPVKSLSSFIAGFKAKTTREINVLYNSPGATVWQPRFYEHIIRSESDLTAIREYILNNPANWERDKENPAYIR